jgi:hypothetical protein
LNLRQKDKKQNHLGIKAAVWTYYFWLLQLSETI